MDFNVGSLGEVREVFQSRLIARRKRRQEQRRRELIIIIAFFSLLLGYFLWRYFVYARTPEYALQAIAASVDDHDPDKFDKYVKLDALTLVAYDDLTTNMFKFDRSLTSETHTMFLKFYQHIKPQLAKGTANTIRDFLKTGEWNLPEQGDLLKGRQLGIDFDRFLERSQVRNTELTKIGDCTINPDAPDEATAEINVRDRYTGMSYVLKLLLNRQDGGYWSVIAIENYREYLDTIATRQNNDIDEYIAATQGVVDEYNERFIDQRRRFRDIVARAKPPSETQINALAEIINEETIPDLKARQERLNSFDIRAGSQYLSGLRRQSTDLSIAAWTHFINGLKKNDLAELNTAEALHKQVLEVDLRIEDVIRHNTVSQEMPTVP